MMVSLFRRFAVVLVVGGLFVALSDSDVQSVVPFFVVIDLLLLIPGVAVFLWRVAGDGVRLARESAPV